VEVLLSAVSPFELLAGKILGLAGAGLAAVTACGALVAGVAAYRGLVGVVRPSSLVYFLLYYVPAFLLAASAFAAIGAACNQLKETQGLVLPVLLPFAIPLFAWVPITTDPSGPLAVALSFIPPTAAQTMVLRLAASPNVPVLHVVLSMAVLWISVPIAMRAAARVFRTGILMYGKRPGLREIARWALTD
jgi:ABC-2 type transport system permease protein